MASPTVQAGWLSRLSAGEVRRRMFHMLPGFLPFLLWVIPHRDPVGAPLRWILVSIAIVIGGRFMLNFRDVSRGSHDRAAPSVLGYVLSFLGAVLLFPDHLEIALAVLAILAFGDGSATLFGLCLPTASLPWNRRKSWSGLLGFIVVGLPMASVIYWGETFNPGAVNASVSLATAFGCVGPAVLLAAFVETLPVRLDDNIRVGTTAVVAVATMHAVLIGL